MLQTIRFSFTVAHATYETCKTWMACQACFIVVTVRTYDVQNVYKTWMACQLYLLFSKSVHMTYETYTDYHPVWGLLRLAPINAMSSANVLKILDDHNSLIYILHVYGLGLCDN